MKFETLQQYAGACLSALEVQFPQFTWTRKAWRDDGPGVSVEITYLRFSAAYYASAGGYCDWSSIWVLPGDTDPTSAIAFTLDSLSAFLAALR